jgi:hypothetical protein
MPIMVNKGNLMVQRVPNKGEEKGCIAYIPIVNDEGFGL